MALDFGFQFLDAQVAAQAGTVGDGNVARFFGDHDDQGVAFGGKGVGSTVTHAVAGVAACVCGGHGQDTARGHNALAVQEHGTVVEGGIGEKQGAEQSGADAGVQDFTGLFVVTQAHALFKDDQGTEMVLGQVLYGSSDGLGHIVKSAGVEKDGLPAGPADGLANSGQGAADFGLEKNHDGDNAQGGKVGQKPEKGVEFPPLGKEPGHHQEHAADDHLDGTCPAEQLEHIVQDNGHDEDVQNIRHADIDDVKKLKQDHRTLEPPGRAGIPSFLSRRVHGYSLLHPR